MAQPELGPWEPLSLTDTIEVFRAAKFRWWISGGWALELHLGNSWRKHDDTDVGLARPDVRKLRSVLDGWDIHVAVAVVPSRTRPRRSNPAGTVNFETDLSSRGQ